MDLDLHKLLGFSSAAPMNSASEKRRSVTYQLSEIRAAFPDVKDRGLDRTEGVQKNLPSPVGVLSHEGRQVVRIERSMGVHRVHFVHSGDEASRGPPTVEIRKVRLASPRIAVEGPGPYDDRS